mmetsp:Transcript_58253/g.185586  ORF Transcript_58253/g.185586 Transcript_58253/m.185586 type:complete len:206 (-) Transcript_58253:470-1087(-)
MGARAALHRPPPPHGAPGVQGEVLPPAGGGLHGGHAPLAPLLHGISHPPPRRRRRLRRGRGFGARGHRHGRPCRARVAHGDALARWAHPGERWELRGGGVVGGHNCLGARGRALIPRQLDGRAQRCAGAHGARMGQLDRRLHVEHADGQGRDGQHGHDGVLRGPRVQHARGSRVRVLVPPRVLAGAEHQSAPRREREYSPKALNP